LRFVAERAELGEQREAVVAVTIPEKPGSFRKFCDLLGNRTITEFNYRYAGPNQAHIFVGITVRNRSEVAKLTELLERHQLPAVDLTDNEMAKTHVRYMVGGHAPQAENEIIYRFTFPERPGALLDFLSRLRSDWNISLFHYRNHGADFGRVLAGIQVPPIDQASFADFLQQLGYEYTDETANPAYHLFLG
jgi:threonine dehydratase